MKSDINLRHFYQLDSTNSFLKSHMIDFPHKTIVIADQQTNGRGKGSNRWLSSNTNNLYMSILLKGPALTADHLSSLTQFLAIIAAETINHMDPFSIKKTQVMYPNDLMIEGKKVGGILADASFIGNNLIGVVLGIGINIKLSDPEKAQINQPNTSLLTHFKNVPHKSSMAESLLQCFFDQYEDYQVFGKEMFEKKINHKPVNQKN
jgi:BirA family biotin operon repressor/biotin-[acetyl-CoA-carboxylase] ligase